MGSERVPKCVFFRTPQPLPVRRGGVGKLAGVVSLPAQLVALPKADLFHSGVLQQIFPVMERNTLQHRFPLHS